VRKNRNFKKNVPEMRGCRFIPRVCCFKPILKKVVNKIELKRTDFEEVEKETSDADSAVRAYRCFYERIHKSLRRFPFMWV